jgi:uncharacterized protein YtpQ (UPF0354 family)
VDARLFALLACLAAVLAGCAGDDSTGGDEDVVLARSSFKEVVVNELTKADVEAEGGYGLVVHVRAEPNQVDLRLQQPFQQYRRDPERREEIVSGLVQEAKRRLEDGIGGVSFAEARGSLMPLVKPRFAIRTWDQEPAQTRTVGGLAVVYAVDRENDFTIVTAADVERWGQPLADLHELAFDNLLRQTNQDQKLLCEPSDGEELCGWASGDGYDATRMLVPELRRQIERVYDGPAVYAVPMEHVFVALSFEVATRRGTEKALRTRVEQQFQTSENPVSPELFVERGAKLVVF